MRSKQSKTSKDIRSTLILFLFAYKFHVYIYVMYVIGGKNEPSTGLQMFGHLVVLQLVSPFKVKAPHLPHLLVIQSCSWIITL